MPKEPIYLSEIISGDEPGLIARFLHTLSGEGEGSWGEKCIARVLKNRIENAEFYQNVYIPIEDRTAELDIVMIDKTGIYVFESKAYGGTIYGNPEYMKWVQYLGGQKSTFYNPVKQNERHCYYLSKALKIPRKTIESFVVFENRASLANVSPLKGEQYTICKRKRLADLLLDKIYSKTTVFTEADIADIKKKLKEWSTNTEEKKKEHIQQVKVRMNSNICPVCGKNLITRKGKYGEFIGCTGYPQCKYTRNLK